MGPFNGVVGGPDKQFGAERQPQQDKHQHHGGRPPAPPALPPAPRARPVPPRGPVVVVAWSAITTPYGLVAVPGAGTRPPAPAAQGTELRLAMPTGNLAR